MIYYKTLDEDGVVSVNTLNEKGKGNIDEKEYSMIIELFRKMPVGKVLIETEKGYEYADAPDDPSKGGLTPDEAWKIIESSNISKENKQLLKDYIYKEG